MVEEGDPPADPERLLIVARFEDGRYLLVRDGEELPARLPAVRQGGPSDPPGEATRAALELGLGLLVLGEPRLADERLPVREREGRYGRSGPCWLRGAAARVEGEPQPQPPIEAALRLPLEEAADALGTSRERVLLRACAALLEPDGP